MKLIVQLYLVWYIELIHLVQVSYVAYMQVVHQAYSNVTVA